MLLFVILHVRWTTIYPNWNSLSSQDDYASALNELLVTNPFPEFTGRVCPAPCENAYVLGINHSPVSIQSIEHSLVEMGFDNQWIKPRIPSSRSGLSIAVMGSGPAGLSAAERLRQLGYRVVVYEKSDRVGGLLTYGIPDFKLEKSVVERRVNMMQQEVLSLSAVLRSVKISQLVNLSVIMQLYLQSELVKREICQLKEGRQKVSISLKISLNTQRKKILEIRTIVKFL